MKEEQFFGQHTMGKSRSPADARGVTLLDYDEYIVDEQYYAMENYVEDSNFRHTAEAEEGLGKALNECLGVNCAFTPVAENQHRKKVGFQCFKFQLASIEVGGYPNNAHLTVVIS